MDPKLSDRRNSQRVLRGIKPVEGNKLSYDRTVVEGLEKKR
jgi:hypothetical protein